MAVFHLNFINDHGDLDGLKTSGSLAKMSSLRRLQSWHLILSHLLVAGGGSATACAPCKVIHAVTLGIARVGVCRAIKGSPSIGRGGSERCFHASVYGVSASHRWSSSGAYPISRPSVQDHCENTAGAVPAWAGFRRTARRANSGAIPHNVYRNVGC